MLDGGELLIPRPLVLPGNATPFERALASIDGHILDLPAEIIRLAKDPAATPAHLLPHLAWERSVDVWDPAWPEDMKRRVILASYIVHRYKGTRYAVEKALEALGFKTSVKEWWQTTPQGQPYTFKVTAFALERLIAGQPVITEPMTRAALAAVIAAKPVSRALSFEVVAGASSRAKIAACGRAFSLVSDPVIAGPAKTPAASLRAATRGRGLQITLPETITGPAKTPAMRISIGARARVLTIVTHRMEATLQ